MSSTVVIGPFYFLVFLSSLAAVPLAGPPRPLDPTLSAIAPQQCIFYAASAGVTEADSASKNQTEQLFAEPEVRHFVESLMEQVLNATRRAAGNGSGGQRVVATELPKLVQAFISCPSAMYVEDFEILDEGISMQAGLVLSALDRRAELDAALTKLVDSAVGNGAPIGTFKQDGEMWSVLRFSMDTPEIRWGWKDNYFIFAVGDGTRETIIERMQGAAPAWLKKLREQHPVERENSLSYVNLEVLLDRFQPIISDEGAWPVIEKLGLTELRVAHSIAGFDEQACATTAHLVIDGRRSGLLSLLPYKPLARDDLQMIPEDAIFAAAARIDVKETWENLVRLIADVDPEAGEQIEQALWQIESQLDIRVEDDLFGSFGDIGTVHVPGGDLMTSWLGSAVAAKVKDADRLRKVVETLVVVARASLPPGDRPGIKIRENEFSENTIYTLEVIGEPFPFTPSWCVADDWMIFGLNPQTVRAMLTRRDQLARQEDPVSSLADLPEIREAFGSSAAPTVTTYLDTPAAVRSAYPLLQLGAQMLSGELRREGFDIDTSILPSRDAIVRHLRPSVSTFTSMRDGFQFRAKHSLPGGGGAIALVPLVAAGVMPATQGARAAARDAQELNNMKQIALACFNYESVHGHFPANIVDEDGKPLLSWRVQILPYLEQNALYDQFHLDEPWDSEHNKPLSELMLATFSSPHDPVEGKTRYLTLQAKETAFSGDEGMQLRKITDGTSNTIMFVNAAPESAVVWSKPEDINFDAKKPFQGIEGPAGRFAASMCDGSVQRFSPNIGKAAMRALATRAGEEVIDWEKLGR